MPSNKTTRKYDIYADQFQYLGWRGGRTKAATSSDCRKKRLRKEKTPPRISIVMKIREMPMTSRSL